MLTVNELTATSRQLLPITTSGSGKPPQIIPLYQTGNTATYSGTFEPFILTLEVTPNPDFYGWSYGSSVPLTRASPPRNQVGGQNNFQSSAGNDFLLPGEAQNWNGQRGDWSFPERVNEPPNSCRPNNGGQAQSRGAANQQGNFGQYNDCNPNSNNRNDRSSYGK
ncbi:hypothetical protein RvY_00307 [Ramazzottius varieornatus]|uniref:Uncharacterized protein n=1 Tax=Ramazzottius varieornatus TaxID=947166 RepID=A0A1D1UIM8_RAMVA|nr:hypothetical protein RvY_00307 [Ramazzottius varieornatus]